MIRSLCEITFHRTPFSIHSVEGQTGPWSQGAWLVEGADKKIVRGREEKAGKKLEKKKTENNGRDVLLEGTQTR